MIPGTRKVAVNIFVLPDTPTLLFIAREYVSRRHRFVLKRQRLVGD